MHGCLSTLYTDQFARHESIAYLPADQKISHGFAQTRTLACIKFLLPILNTLPIRMFHRALATHGPQLVVNFSYNILDIVCYSLSGFAGS